MTGFVLFCGVTANAVVFDGALVGVGVFRLDVEFDDAFETAIREGMLNAVLDDGLEEHGRDAGVVHIQIFINGEDELEAVVKAHLLQLGVVVEIVQLVLERDGLVVHIVQRHTDHLGEVPHKGECLVHIIVDNKVLDGAHGVEDEVRVHLRLQCLGLQIGDARHYLPLLILLFSNVADAQTVSS